MKALTPEKLSSLRSFPGLVDSHIHLDSQAYHNDLEDCLRRASQFGVESMILPSLDLDSSRRIALLVKEHSCLAGALGVHPHQASSFDPQTTPGEWERLLREHPWVAVGETGLELHYDFCPLETQQVSLQAHLDLAERTRLPLILHCRLAEALLYEALQARKGRLQGVVHCFTGGWEWAQKFLDLGFYLGLGGLVTLPKAHEVHEVASKVPSDRFLLETDGPYLSPVPLRGYRNESCLLPLVVERLQELRGDGALEIVQQARTNTRQLFRLLA